MDRSDEKRSGDVLGLGGITPDTASAPHPSKEDPDEVRRRRERMRGGSKERMWSGTEDIKRGSAGATGADMGAGGKGTDVE
jgi:hypothetical protein